MLHTGGLARLDADLSIARPLTSCLISIRDKTFVILLWLTNNGNVVRVQCLYNSKRRKPGSGDKVGNIRNPRFRLYALYASYPT